MSAVGGYFGFLLCFFCLSAAVYFPELNLLTSGLVVVAFVSLMCDSAGVFVPFEGSKWFPQILYEVIKKQEKSCEKMALLELVEVAKLGMDVTDAT